MHSQKEQRHERSLKIAALHWDSTTPIVRLLLALSLAAGCHAEGQPALARPRFERRAAEPPVEHAPREHSAAEDDEIRRTAKRPEYSAFFNALKRQVSQSWDPVSVWRSIDPTGTVYGRRTRVTEVRVSLSRSGELAKLTVTSQSGVEALDDEALRAFRTAGPFSPPPDGLVGRDDLVTFPFSFFFETGASHVKRSTPAGVSSAASSSPSVTPPAVPAVPVEQSPGPATTTDAQRESAGPAKRSQMPVPMTSCVGKYTPEARAAATEGVVILDLIVDELGRTRDITVVEGLPHGLTESAIAALRECRFAPGEKDGRPVPVRVRGFKVRFLLQPMQ